MSNIAIFVPDHLTDLSDFANPLGAIWTVASHAARNLIPNAQRIEGATIAYTQNDQQYWRLNPGGTTGTDSDWAQLTALSTYQPPAFTAFALGAFATTQEVGATVPSGARAVTWATSNAGNIEANSIGIADTTLSTALLSGAANNGSNTVTIPGGIVNNAPASHVWTISGANSVSGAFSRTFTIAWEWKVYFGESSNVTLTALQIAALPSSGLQAGFATTYAQGASNYKYLCFPDSLGSPANFIDVSTGLPVAMATASDNAAYSNTANGYSYALVSVTNVNSVTTNYRVYRTQNSLGSALNMAVS
jgi:hypothetical protein